MKILNFLLYNQSIYKTILSLTIFNIILYTNFHNDKKNENNKFKNVFSYIKEIIHFIYAIAIFLIAGNFIQLKALLFLIVIMILIFKIIVNILIDNIKITDDYAITYILFTTLILSFFQMNQ